MLQKVIEELVDIELPTLCGLEVVRVPSLLSIIMVLNLICLRLSLMIRRSFTTMAGPSLRATRRVVMTAQTLMFRSAPWP